MREVLTLAMEAHSEERNHHRRYEIHVGKDLLNHWVVVVRYGRVGQPLQEMQFADPDIDAAKRVVRERLRRRLTAPQRIGCAYRVVSAPAPCDTEWRGWMQALIGKVPFAAISGYGRFRLPDVDNCANSMTRPELTGRQSSIGIE